MRHELKDFHVYVAEGSFSTDKSIYLCSTKTTFRDIESPFFKIFKHNKSFLLSAVLATNSKKQI
tara:strand:+ start:619 stop:810 length:192 start_codon:yes stop_codon:yes gene_type:complete